MVRISQITSREMQNALDEYWEVLQTSQLSDKSVEDYFYFAFCFVRWMNGNFTPGSNLK